MILQKRQSLQLHSFFATRWWGHLFLSFAPFDFHALQKSGIAHNFPMTRHRLSHRAIVLQNPNFSKTNSQWISKLQKRWFAPGYRINTPSPTTCCSTAPFASGMLHFAVASFPHPRCLTPALPQPVYPHPRAHRYTHAHCIVPRPLRVSQNAQLPNTSAPYNPIPEPQKAYPVPTHQLPTTASVCVQQDILRHPNTTHIALFVGMRYITFININQCTSKEQHRAQEI
jgi:hypothetical protein